MKRYRYKAKDKKGNLIEGEVEASNEQSAAKLVRQQGLVVISLKSSGGMSLSLFKGITEKITSGDINNFTRQFSIMVNAGLPITEALNILRAQSKASMQRVVSRILADVEEGDSLSTAMGRHPTVFSKTYVALIKSGEVGGVMDEVLVKLSEDLEKQEEFRGKVKGALIYPIIIVIAMIVVALIMVIFVVPRLSLIYDQFNADLPATTKFLVGFSNLMIRFWPIVLLAVAGAVVGFKAYVRTKEGKEKIDEYLFKLPVVGDLQRQIILADLTRTLSLMLASGVSILEGLAVTSDVVSNSVLSNAMKDVIKMIEKGFPLAFTFGRHPEAFPFIMSQMIAVGEETGKMDEVFGKLAHVFEVESEQKVKTLTAAVEPAILILLGIGVAFLVISIIMPIYNLTTNLSIQ